MKNNNEVKSEILLALGINEIQWMDVLVDSGVNAIRHLSDNSEMWVELLKDNRAFWAWYADQFTIVDRKFLTQYRYKGSNSDLKEKLFNIWVDVHTNGMSGIQLPGAIIKNLVREGVEL